MHGQQVDDIDKDATTVKELYDLIETYKVPTPPEDLAEYQVSRRQKMRFCTRQRQGTLLWPVALLEYDNARVCSNAVIEIIQVTW